MDEKFFLTKKHVFWSLILAGSFFIYYKIHGVLLPFYIAFFTTILFSSVIDFFEKKFHMSRTCVAGIITISVCAFLAYIVSLMFQLAFSRVTTFSTNIMASNISQNVSEGTDIIDGATVYLSKFLDKYNIHEVFNTIAKHFADTVVGYAKHVVRNILSYSSNLFSATCLLALTPIVMFMMLKDIPIIKRRFYALLPTKIKKETQHLFNEMHESVFKYIEGQALASIILSVLYALVLLPIGANHFILLGLIIGFSSFVPYVGFYLATAITLFSVYTQFYDIKKTVIVLIVMLALQIVDSGFITPKIVGNKLGIHPLAIIFGVLVSVPLFGIFGILLALPLVGIANVIISFLIKKYKNSLYYSE